MGYVLLGISVGSATGINGAVFQMVAHGITSAALFFVVGVVYERAHHRVINQFGGLMAPMPLYGGLSIILIFASAGLPGLCNFWGEFLVMLAAWEYHPGLAIPAILTTIITAAYLLWTMQRVFFGVNPATASYKDLTLREALCLVPFVGLALLLGIVPTPVLMSWMESSVTGLAETLLRATP
jgi:NADH-quinone oxidoreductase subunit M